MVQGNMEGKNAIVTGARRGIGRAIVEEFAKAVLFLASEDSSFMTGAVLNVDGGRLI